MSQIIINGQPLYQVDLPEMTLAQWLALPVAERPKEWIRTDANYTDIPAENVELSDGTSVEDAIDELGYKVYTFTAKLYQANWSQSGTVYYLAYADAYVIPDATEILAITETSSWGQVTPNEIITPYITGDRVSVRINTNSSNAQVEYRVLYR